MKQKFVETEKCLAKNECDKEGRMLMKKIKTLAIGLLFVLCMAILTGCQAGTYKFSSMKASVGALTIEYKVGDEFLGTTITEDFCVIDMKMDGSVTYQISDNSKLEGTWSKSETVKNGYDLNFDNTSLSVVISGGKLTMEWNGMSLVLEK